MSVNEYIYRYYSQHGEDYLLCEFFERKKHGFYVEVGAFDGRYLSNTYSFEEKGWTGICVEPSPRFFALCTENRPNSICINAACVGDESIDTIELNAEESGLLSSVDNSNLFHEDLVRRYRDSGFEFKGIDKIRVKAKTLDQILEEHCPPGQEIDFVSIDVENYEEQVLAGFDVTKFRPRVMIIETNTAEAETRITDTMMEKYGYHLVRRLGINSIYVHSLTDAEKILGIPIECAIEKQLHPLGIEYSYTPFVKGVVYSERKDDQLKRRLELLQQNGGKWMQCRRELERVSSRQHFEEQLEGLLESIDDINRRHGQYFLYGTNVVADLCHSRAPGSVVAFIDDQARGICKIEGVPVIAPGDIHNFGDYPIVIARVEDEEAIVRRLEVEYGVSQSRMLILSTGSAAEQTSPG